MDSQRSITRLVLIVAACAAIIGLVAFARGEPGGDGRISDRDQSAAVYAPITV